MYSVGDIHGRADLLDKVAAWIEADLKNSPSPATTVFLGDYVDRGPASAAVLDRLARSDFPTEIVTLRGNHEEMLLQFLEDETVLDSWRRYGGLETLHSYGVSVAAAMRGQGFDTTRKAFQEKLPAQHLEFLLNTKMSMTSGDYFFCHAGVRPNVPLSQQVPQDLLWIRQEFLNFNGSFGKMIVHGHTPVEKPDFKPNRINVDTGAFATGALTCLALEGDTVRHFTTS